MIGLGGRDILRGGDGEDTLLGGTGDDTFDGGAARDRVSFCCGQPATSGVIANLTTGVVTGGLGSDTIILGTVEILVGTESFGDTLTGNGGGNRLIGLGGADTLSATDGISGNDSVYGGAGTDSCSADPGDHVFECP